MVCLEIKGGSDVSEPDNGFCGRERKAHGTEARLYKIQRYHDMAAVPRIELESQIGYSRYWLE